MFTTQEGYVYRMPIVFGGYEYAPVSNTYHDVVSMMVTVETERNALEAYVPAQFELLRPEYTVNYAQCREIDWLAGGSYNLIDVSVPVRFRGTDDDVTGSFSLVVWENLTEPILGGREETGVAKIFCDISDIHQVGSEHTGVASFAGNTFLRMGIDATEEITGERMASLKHLEMNSMHWRYIPAVGGPGASLSEIVLYPQLSEMERAWTGKATLEWLPLTATQSPTQWWISSQLAALPVKGLKDPTYGQGKIVLTSSKAKVLK
ncbi:MAG: acetoacetate decarboxylase family protein [Promicromonosporaceae bacterium]|nr:acetoacetate decarboxylase family protein [Promicromonosporaceae bacterium]